MPRAHDTPDQIAFPGQLLPGEQEQRPLLPPLQYLGAVLGRRPRPEGQEQLRAAGRVGGLRAAGGDRVPVFPRSAGVQIAAQVVRQLRARRVGEVLVAEDGGAVGHPDESAVRRAGAGTADGAEILADPVDGQEHHGVAHHGPGRHGITVQVSGGVALDVEDDALLAVGDQHRPPGGAVQGADAQIDAVDLVGQHGIGDVQHAAHGAGHILRGEVQHPVVYRHQVDVGGGGRDQQAQQESGADRRRQDLFPAPHPSASLHSSPGFRPASQRRAMSRAWFAARFRVRSRRAA